MFNKIKRNQPTPKQLAMFFKKRTNCDPPENNKTYHCDTPSPVRAIAEFEPMGGVLIAYPGTTNPSDKHKQLPPGPPRSFGIPDELIIKMQQLDSDSPVHIFIMCDDENELSKVINNLAMIAQAKGLKFDPDLIHFVPWDTDTYWTRDYAPWWVINEKTGCYGVAKHIYTTLGGGSVGLVEGAENVNPREGSGIFRPNDDYGADRFSDFLNAPIRKWNNAVWGDPNGDNGNRDPKKLPPIAPHDWFFTGLLDVGGNYMVTDDAVIASSYLVATQNELPVDSEEQITHPCPEVIEKRMQYIMEQTNRFLGANTYHVLTDPSGTYIGHIDCWGKFLARRKVLIAQSQNPQVNQGYDSIAKYFEANGFEVFRVLCQDMYVPIVDTPATTAAYTNSLILNNYVYVPLAGGQYKFFDDLALGVYQQALPDYTIVGVIGKPETPWLGTDALHCRTHGVPRKVVNDWLQSQTAPVIDSDVASNK